MKKKKNSVMKKLIPATSMLLVSATMLTASTYAWFTMSREVEVTGIKMTAIVPEDLQISLGDETETGTRFLKGTDGNAITSGGNVYVGSIKAPTVDNNTNDWHNSVSFSDFYVAAKLAPASSTDGNYLFKTADATSKGETVSKTAAFDLVKVATDATTNRNDMAALYINNTSSTQSTTNAAVAQRDNSGYYVDFPVWFRTSSSTSNSTGLTADSKLQLGVKATITQNTGIESEEDLYHAVRIAVLPATANDATGIANTSGSLTGVIHDDVEKDSKKYYNRYQAATSELTDNAIVRQAVKANGYLNYNPSSGKQTNVGSLYGDADVVLQASNVTDGLYTDGEVVVKVPLATDEKSYGSSVKYIIRVWLEGEDVYCWNPNAGQDWNVNLQFVKLDTTAASHSAPSDQAGGSGTSSSITGTNGLASESTTATRPTNSSINVTATASNGQTLSGTYTYSAGSVSGGTAIDAFLDDTHRADEVVSTDPSTVYGTGNQTYTLADGTRIGNSTDLKAYIIRNAGEYDLSTIDLGTGVAN